MKKRIFISFLLLFCVNSIYLKAKNPKSDLLAFQCQQKDDEKEKYSGTIDGSVEIKKAVLGNTWNAAGQMHLDLDVVEEPNLSFHDNLKIKGELKLNGSARVLELKITDNSKFYRLRLKIDQNDNYTSSFIEYQRKFYYFNCEQVLSIKERSCK